MKMKAVKIKWNDSCTSHIGWTLLEELEENIKPVCIETYGIIVQEDDGCITVAQNHGIEPDQVCNLMTIPKGCIITIEDINCFPFLKSDTEQSTQ